jgi:hypothetical protein
LSTNAKVGEEKAKFDTRPLKQKPRVLASLTDDDDISTCGGCGDRSYSGDTCYDGSGDTEACLSCGWYDDSNDADGAYDCIACPGLHCLPYIRVKHFMCNA